MSESDVWRTAALYLRDHGAHAGLRAGMTRLEHHAKGDTARAELWHRIARAIAWLQAGKPEAMTAH